MLLGLFSKNHKGKPNVQQINSKEVERRQHLVNQEESPSIALNHRSNQLWERF